MGRRIAAKITGVAGYLPPRVLTNAELEKTVDTTDEWIRTRTGIRERHIVDKGMAASHMAVEAAKRLLAERGVDPARVPVVVGGIIPDDDAKHLMDAGVARVYTPVDFDATRIMGEVADLIARAHGS